MEITKESIRQKISDCESTMSQLLANYHANEGAVSILKQLLEDLEKKIDG